MADYLCDIECQEITEVPSNLFCPTQAEKNLDQFSILMCAIYSRRIHTRSSYMSPQQITMSYQMLCNMISETLDRMSVRDFLNEDDDYIIYTMLDALEKALDNNLECLYDYHLAVVVHRLEHLRWHVEENNSHVTHVESN